MHKLKELLSRTPAWERRFARKFQLQAIARMNELLTRSPLDQKALADAAGWDKSFVSRLLSGGGGNLTLKTVARFEEAVGADVLAVTRDAPASRPRHWVQPSAAEPTPDAAVLRTVAGTQPRRVLVYTDAHD